MPKYLMAMALAALLALPAAAQDEEEGRLLDLETVLREALGTNEVIAQAAEEVEKSKLLRRMAWSAVIPSSEFSFTGTRNDTEQSFAFSDDMEFTITPLYDWSVAFNVSQPVYLGGRSFKTLSQSGINIGLNEDNLDTSKRNTLFQVAAAYVQVVKAQRDLEISRKSLELAKRQLRQAEVLYRAGEAIRTSVLRAETGVAAAEVAVITTQNMLDRAKEDLALLCGIVPPFRVAPIESEPSLPTRDLDGLVDFGLRGRSEIRAAEKQIEISDLEIGKAFGEKLPSVFLNFNYTKQKANFPSDQFWRLILNVSVPVFDGGISTVNKATAEANHRQALLQKQLLRKQVRAEIAQAYLDYTSAEEALTASRKQVETARQAYEDIERFHKVGEATDLDVQDARQQLIEAELSLSNLTSDKLLALFNLRRQLGIAAVEIR